MSRPVLLESPYAGDVARNIRYAEACMLDSLKRGEAPLLGHLLYTRVLDDLVPAQRAQGIAAHLAWMSRVDAVVFYLDLGMSSGMRAALSQALDHAVACRVPVPTEFRQLGGRWETAPESHSLTVEELVVAAIEARLTAIDAQRKGRP